MTNSRQEFLDRLVGRAPAHRSLYSWLRLRCSPWARSRGRA
jgi:hypothetical protein